jgi:hypothetical protein
MKHVIWTDKNGWKHHSLVENDSDRPELGLPCDPPPVEALDWEEIKKEINNLLVDKGLYSLKDIYGENSGILSVAGSVINKKLLALYKRQEVEK